MKRLFFLTFALLSLTVLTKAYAGVSDSKSFKMSVTLPESVQSLEQHATPLSDIRKTLELYQEAQYTEIRKNNEHYMLMTYVVR